MKPGRAVLLLIACGVLVGAGACRSDAPESDALPADSVAPSAGDSLPVASGGPRACDVVSAADLARITGIQLQEGVLTNDYGGVSQCRWRRADGTDNGVTISLREQGDMGIYTSVPGARPIADVGDEAVWNPDTHQLAFRRGVRLASVTFLFPEGREAWAREIAAIIQRALPADAEPPRP